MQKLRLHSFGMLLGVLMTFPVGAMCDDNYNKQQRDLQNDQHAGASGNMGDQNDQRRYRMKSNSGQSALDQEEQQDVRQMLGSLIESAVAGDAEDVVD
ncbi:MAG: hypothetical protein KDD42_00690 [Bdellovibrionales bacterium]|nr:hypothetical protein [Bdellovibrionales bacterium]